MVNHFQILSVVSGFQILCSRRIKIPAVAMKINHDLSSSMSIQLGIYLFYILEFTVTFHLKKYAKSLKTVDKLLTKFSLYYASNI